jgi:hypothetical protein
MFKYLFDVIYKNSTPQISNLTHILINSFNKDELTIKNKFAFYEKTNANNVFIGDAEKDEFNQVFCRIQFVYFTLTKFVNMIKIKRAETVVDKDLCLNPLVATHKNTICIYQNNGKYLFSVLDIRKIIYNALTNATRYFFSEPLPIKNPYNNIPFTKSNLYNIYFYIIFNTHHNIDMFHNFFKLDFDLNLFFDTYEYMLREHAIRNFVYNGSVDALHKEIMLMLTDYNVKNSGHKILIHKEFPKKTLVAIMRPYLLLDITRLYSLIDSKKQHSRILLKTKLVKFHKFNPAFGRKTLNVSTKIVNFKIKKVTTVVFNEDHIHFNKKTTDEFLTNHTEFDYATTLEHLVAFITETPLFANLQVTSITEGTYNNEDDVYGEEADEDTTTASDSSEEDTEEEEEEDIGALINDVIDNSNPSSNPSSNPNNDS